MSERNLFALSIKHTEYRWKFGMPCWLWGKRTADNEKRSFGGYTQYPYDAELYTQEEFADKYGGVDCIKVDEPVTMCINFCKKYREYDTVLVSEEQYIQYCKAASLPLSEEEDNDQI